MQGLGQWSSVTSDTFWPYFYYWKFNIKMDLKKNVLGATRFDWSGSEYATVMCPCEKMWDLPWPPDQLLVSQTEIFFCRLRDSQNKCILRDTHNKCMCILWICVKIICSYWRIIFSYSEKKKNCIPSLRRSSFTFVLSATSARDTWLINCIQHRSTHHCINASRTF